MPMAKAIQYIYAMCAAHTHTTHAHTLHSASHQHIQSDPQPGYSKWSTSPGCLGPSAYSLQLLEETPGVCNVMNHSMAGSNHCSHARCKDAPRSNPNAGCHGFRVRLASLQTVGQLKNKRRKSALASMFQYTSTCTIVQFMYTCGEHPYVRYLPDCIRNMEDSNATEICCTTYHKSSLCFFS